MAEQREKGVWIGWTGVVFSMILMGIAIFVLYRTGLYLTGSTDMRLDPDVDLPPALVASLCVITACVIGLPALLFTWLVCVTTDCVWIVRLAGIRRVPRAAVVSVWLGKTAGMRQIIVETVDAKISVYPVPQRSHALVKCMQEVPGDASALTEKDSITD